MSLNIYPLNLGNITLDKSGLVLFQDAGVKTTIPTLGFLITGGEYPVLVDTGSRSTDYYRQFGFEAEQTREMTLAWLLAQHGLKPADIRYVIHTHAHVDHAGGDYLFPVTTTVCLSRRELAFAASGIMGPAMYALEDTRHLLERLYTRGALRLFDVDGSYEEEVIPGVTVRLSGGHTPGSISVLVDTAERIANISGDVVYNLQGSLIDPFLDSLNAGEPTITGNRAMSTLEEKTAIKRALAGVRFMLPSHDVPALVQGGRVIGLLHNAISRPEVRVTDSSAYTLL